MTGSFILIDPVTNNTVAAGMIRGATREVNDLRDVSSDAQEMRRRRQEQVAWEAGAVSLVERETRNGHRAAVALVHRPFRLGQIDDRQTARAPAVRAWSVIR